MTVQWGDTGRVAYGPLKTFNITLANPRETLNGTPTALPTTEPATSQISFTIQSSDLPTISPAPISLKYAALLYASGKNTDAASQTVNWRVLKNSVSVATGSQTGVASNQFWTHSYFQFFDVAVGDVLEIRLWSTSANVNYDYYAIALQPTRINLGKSYINKDVSYTNLVNHPALALGTPNVQSTAFTGVNACSIANQPTNVSGSATFGALSWTSPYFAGRINNADQVTSVTTLTHATNHPQYQRNSIPSAISFREVLR